MIFELHFGLCLILPEQEGILSEDSPCDDIANEEECSPKESLDDVPALSDRISQARDTLERVKSSVFAMQKSWLDAVKNVRWHSIPFLAFFQIFNCSTKPEFSWVQGRP